MSKSAETKMPGELRLMERGSGFGFSCAMDAAGNYILIGAPGQDLQAGIVYAFSYSPKSSRWSEIGQFQGPSRKSSDSFGWAVASSDDGSTFVVSARGRRANNGEVYVFQCRSGPLTNCDVSATISPPESTNDRGPRGIRIRNNFGVSLDLSSDGRLLVIGSTGPNSEQGVVYVLSHDGDARNWTIVQKLEPPSPMRYAFFGYKVSLDAKGTILAVGADGENSYQGSVYVYERSEESSSCSVDPFVQRIGGMALFGGPHQIRLSKPRENDNFGGSLALSGNGEILAVGSPGLQQNGEADHGGVLFYGRDSSIGQSTWELFSQSTLSRSDAASGTFYSWAVALDYNASRFVSTAPSAYQDIGIATVGAIDSSPDMAPEMHNGGPAESLWLARRLTDRNRKDEL